MFLHTQPSSLQLKPGQNMEKHSESFCESNGMSLSSFDSFKISPRHTSRIIKSQVPYWKSHALARPLWTASKNNRHKSSWFVTWNTVMLVSYTPAFGVIVQLCKIMKKARILHTAHLPYSTHLHAKCVQSCTRVPRHRGTHNSSRISVSMALPRKPIQFVPQQTTEDPQSGQIPLLL